MTMLSYKSRDGKVDVSRDTANLPEASVNALLSRGFNHVFANEVAASVSGEIKRQIVGDSDRKAADVTKDEVQAWRKENAESIDQFVAEAVTEKLVDLDAGTLGVREPGAAKEEIDPVGAEMDRLAKEAIVKILTANSLKFPTRRKVNGTFEPEVLELPDGKFTGPQLIQRQIARNYDALHKQAEAIVKMRSKAASDGGDLALL